VVPGYAFIASTIGTEAFTKGKMQVKADSFGWV